MQSNATLVDIPAEFRAAVLAQLLTYAQFDAATSCVNYTGYRTPSGYGRFELARGDTHLRIRAHRASWILSHGPIEDPALVVDHLCRNRGCMNPEHLELVTNEENLHRSDDQRGKERRVFVPGSLRGRRRMAPARERDSCTHGHPWPEFLKVDAAGRGRCLACKPVRPAQPHALDRSSCRHGHPWPEFLARKSNGKYFCRQCARADTAAFYERKRAAARVGA